MPIVWSPALDNRQSGRAAVRHERCGSLFSALQGTLFPKFQDLYCLHAWSSRGAQSLALHSALRNAQRHSIRWTRSRGRGRIVRGGLQAWPGRSCLEKTQFALQIGTIEKLDQGSAPAATRGADGRFWLSANK